MWSVYTFPLLQSGLFMVTTFFRSYPPAGTWGLPWCGYPLHCGLYMGNLCSGTWGTASCSYSTDHGVCTQPFLSWGSWLSPWQEPQEQGPSWKQVSVVPLCISAYTCVSVCDSLLVFSWSLSDVQRMFKRKQQKTREVTCAWHKIEYSQNTFNSFMKQYINYVINVRILKGSWGKFCELFFNPSFIFKN